MQMTFGTHEDRGRRQKKTMLDEIDQIIDFGKVERILKGMYTNEGLGGPLSWLLDPSATISRSGRGCTSIITVMESSQECDRLDVSDREV
jgi:hypothetical protein